MKKRYLFFFLLTGLVLMNACKKEHSQENGNNPSEGTLTDDGAGDCLPKTVNGAYVVGVALGASNSIDVQVNVTKAGNYTIYTDTVNGMWFRVSGIFTATGLNTVRLVGHGTPGSIGISNFLVNYGTSGCTIAVTIVGSLGAFTLNGAPGGCMGAVPSGTYTAGTALNATNVVTINVNVTTVGAYSIASTVSNGMTFSGSGVFTSTGAQAIVLNGTGTPTASGTTNIPLTAGASSCSFTISVGGGAGGGTFSVDCTSAVVNGTYTAGTALTATNTVTLSVNVTAIGTYTVSTPAANGISFSATGSFTATGIQTVTLAGTGTPTAAGATTLSVNGGTASCNFVVTVAGGAGAATFTVNCPSAVVNGTYTAGTVLNATNTVTIAVNVTAAGTYNISTTAANGMTFNASGSFAATGAQNVTLNGSGTPTAAGATTIPVTAGTTPCSFPITVAASGGPATFTVNCPSAVINGTYTAGTALTAANTVTIGVTVATVGTYNISTTATNGMTFTASGTFAATGAQNITLVGSGTPGAAGASSIPVTAGTTPCNFVVTVVAGGAVFAVNCGTAVINGTYTQNTALTAANTVTMSVNVTTGGTYNITTANTQGMIFSASGTWAIGTQTLTLTGSGTPTASGTIYIPITAGTTPCNFLVLVAAPTAASDYFPRTTNSNWSFELDDVATDSSITKVIAPTHTALGNIYNVFMSNDGTGFDTSFYARRAGNDYYHYVDLATYIGLDNTQRVEFIFIKDNQPAGNSWTTAAWTNSAQGIPLQFRIVFTITQKDVPVSVTSSLGTITYQNTIVIEEHYEVNVGAGWQSLDTNLGYFRDYYSRNVGWIKDEFIDDTGTLSGKLELRRYIVY